MKLEFLDDISEGGSYPQVVPTKLVRLYDFEPRQAQLLKEVIQNKIINERGTVDLSVLPFIQPINCNLVLRLSDADDGIIVTDSTNFVCSLTVTAYEKMVHLMEPFCEGSGGYQWLYDLDCPIDFLFSPGGTW
jgi:hypothetical protein